MKTKRQYSSADDPTRERILDSAVRLISGTSVGKLSVRAIAADAGVNVATVHYYFRTKDALIGESFKRFFFRIMVKLDTIYASDTSAAEKLRTFLVYYTDVFFSNPGVFGSLIENFIGQRLHAKAKAPAMPEKILGELIEKAGVHIFDLVGRVSGERDKARIGMLTISLMTSVLHPIFLTDIPEKAFRLSMKDPLTRERYIECCIGKLK